MTDLRAPGNPGGGSRGKACTPYVSQPTYEDGDESSETATGGSIATPIVAKATRPNVNKVH